MNDLLEISFSDNHPGWITDVKIFEVSGRQVRHLAEGRLTGTSPVIFWDGRTTTEIYAITNLHHSGSPLGVQGGRKNTGKPCAVY
jgi:hypothetical protein